MIRIPAKSLAEIRHSNPTRVRKIIHELKYPDEDSAAVGGAYHALARKYIREYHTKSKSPEWLLRRSEDISAEADDIKQTSRANKWNKQRLRSNALGLADYFDFFCDRKFTDLNKASLKLSIGPVEIGLKPDFLATERKQPCIIRLELARSARRERDGKILDTMHQLYVLAALDSGMINRPSQMKLLDVPNGNSINGRHVSARFRDQMLAQCETADSIWKSLHK